MLLLTCSLALGVPAKEFRNLKGTWMCPECARANQADTPEQCEAKGHKHALKLDDGQLITFLDTPRSAALIHGGGREWAKIQVCGLYDGTTRTLDIDAYQIDNVWSTWCDAHDRMDLCRSTDESDAAGIRVSGR